MSGESLSLDQHLASQAAIPIMKFDAREEQRSPIDLPSLMRRCLDDSGFCGMILHKFAARSGDQLTALERALDSANATELARQAHTLLGVAANLSAHALQASAEELESAAVRSDFATAASALERTRAEINRCVSAIPALIARVAPQ